MHWSIKVKPAIWLERLKRDLIYKEFDKIHDQVSNLFKLIYVYPLEKDFGTKIVDSVCSLRVNMIIYQEHIDTKIAIIHQVYNIGGNILNLAKELLYICGSRINNTPLKFKQTYILGVNEVEVPN